ncbi:MAG: hypothetical protein AAF480_05125 [Actinomycetota bacterium]
MATALTLSVVAVVGLVDAIIDDRSGSAVLFGVLAVGIVALSRLRVGETTVTMRRDLASWLDRVSPVTGETPDEMSDRAVSRLRAGFIDLRED